MRAPELATGLIAPIELEAAAPASVPMIEPRRAPRPSTIELRASTPSKNDFESELDLPLRACVRLVRRLPDGCELAAGDRGIRQVKVRMIRQVKELGAEL